MSSRSLPRRCGSVTRRRDASNLAARRRSACRRATASSLTAPSACRQRTHSRDSSSSGGATGSASSRSTVGWSLDTSGSVAGPAGAAERMLVTATLVSRRAGFLRPAARIVPGRPRRAPGRRRHVVSGTASGTARSGRPRARRTCAGCGGGPCRRRRRLRPSRPGGGATASCVVSARCLCISAFIAPSFQWRGLTLASTPAMSSAFARQRAWASASFAPSPALAATTTSAAIRMCLRSSAVSLFPAALP